MGEDNSPLWVIVDTRAPEHVVSALVFPHVATGTAEGSTEGVRHIAASGTSVPKRRAVCVPAKYLQGTHEKRSHSRFPHLRSVALTRGGGTIRYLATGQERRFRRVDNVHRLKARAHGAGSGFSRQDCQSIHPRLGPP